METFDVVVIGAGPGGYPAAIRAARLGAKTALVEREAISGTCLNWGCIPTKALIAGAERLGELRRAREFGIEAGEIRLDAPAMFRRKDAVVAQLQRGVKTLLTGHGVTVFAGEASFASRHEIAIRAADGDAARVRAGRVVIATGSTPAWPGSIPRGPRVVDSRGLLAKPGWPKRMLVAGGGYIGCELAAAAAMLGGEVTIVEMLEDVMAGLDDDVRREVRRGMEKTLGIRILTGRSLDGVQAGPDGVRARAGDEALEADLLLVAVGRKPVTDGLALDRAGVVCGPTGHIDVDERCETSAAGIYAVGDVNGGPQLAHAATSQGTMVAEAIAGGSRRVRETLVPGAIFTSPEVATAGLTEAQAKKDGRAVRVGRFSFAALGRALAGGHAEGFAKWVVDAGTDAVLGAQVVGPRATDLIAEAVLAIRAELTSREIGRAIHAHPTYSEIWMEAAHAVHGECIHAPPPRRRE